MRIRGILTTGVAASAAIALGATSASAIEYDPATGAGFVGKGAVQTALGYNNAALQKAVDAKSLVFTAEQATATSLSQDVDQAGSQAGTQAGTQVGTQSATQTATESVSQDLTCTYTNGNGTKVFHRDGERTATRTGTRTGTREGTREGSRDVSREGRRVGSRSGSLSGSLGYDIDVEARKANQYTGFILKGWKGEPTYTAGATPAWNATQFGDWEFGGWTFGDYTFAGDYQFTGDFAFGDYTFSPMSATVWGAWDAAPGENPDDCLRSSNADKITQLSNVITEGAVTDGTVTAGGVTDGGVTDGGVTEGGVTEGGVTYGTEVSGARTTVGSAKVFVNGKAL
ncbi:hypothetical protein ABZ871_22105 [Streptomyces populi]